MQREDHSVTVAEVKEIMDAAFARSKKNSMKKTMTNYNTALSVFRRHRTLSRKYTRKVNPTYPNYRAATRQMVT